ncbi:MAG: alpha/beta hydrolase [Sphingomonas bacterium]|nr:alpha/beta hydrolase [Sphingomonas bacterium]
MASSPADFRRSYPDDARCSDWFAPDGWRHRRFDWPADHPRAGLRGRILVQGGRADIVEKYLETMAHFHAQGWSVTSFDWRGQGGSGRLSPDRHVGHADDFGIFIDDLAAFWRDWREEGKGPAVILGHSMGGHLVLRSLIERTIDPDVAILVAPMIGIASPVGATWAKRLARLMTMIGDPMRAAWKARPDRKSAGHRQKLLTHDVDRFEDEAFWYARQPDLLLGPPSWAWILEAIRSGQRIESADSALRAIGIPLLMLVADADGLVDPRAAVRVAAKLPHVKLVRFGDEAAHELLREADAVRSRVYATIDDFLDEVA